MKKYGKWIAVALLLSLVFSAVAVNYHKNGAERQNRLSLIYIPKVVDSRNDFWTSLIQGVQMSAQEANVDIEIMAPEEENDVEGQNRILKQAILKNPDAILISPSSFTESNSLLQEARDQGIRITFIDSYTEESIQEITPKEDAVVVNVLNVTPEDEAATGNETINAEGVKVIAANGGVQIIGAQGKKVVITNILGQTVANTVLSSDNATIAAPAGVVVVAIEGEEAVKAIVK